MKRQLAESTGYSSNVTSTARLEGAHWRCLATQALMFWPPIMPTSRSNRQIMIQHAVWPCSLVSLKIKQQRH